MQPRPWPSPSWPALENKLDWPDIVTDAFQAHTLAPGSLNTMSGPWYSCEDYGLSPFFFKFFSSFIKVYVISKTIKYLKGTQRRFDKCIHCGRGPPINSTFWTKDGKPHVGPKPGPSLVFINLDWSTALPICCMLSRAAFPLR